MPVSYVLCQCKCPAEQSGGEYTGRVEYVFGGEADEASCPQPAQPDHRCGYLDNSYSDLTCTGSIIGKGCSHVLEARHFFKLLAVRVYF